jgi:hypothetical protein
LNSIKEKVAKFPGSNEQDASTFLDAYIIAETTKTNLRIGEENAAALKTVGRKGNPFENPEEVPMIFRMMTILILLWQISPACVSQAQNATCEMQSEITQYNVEFATSVCIDPVESHIAVGSEKEKVLFENKCKRWSAFIGSSRVFAVNQFITSGIPPVNRFAQAIIKDWMGVEIPPPSSQRLYNSPGSFGLVKVGADQPDQPRTHTLIVWKSLKGGPGMVGYVLDQLESKEGADPMAKYRVLYPSDRSDPKGKLLVLDASTLEKNLAGDKKDFSVVFLRPSNTVPLYWNQWIQGTDNKNPPTLSKGSSFSYHLDLSALDFRTFIDKNVHPPQMSRPEVQMLVPKLGKYKITVFPIGQFQEKTALTATTEVDDDRLREPLIKGNTPAESRSMREASATHGALILVHNGNASDRPGLAFSFLPTEAGCATLVTLITNEMGNKVIAAWAQSIKVMPPSDQAPADNLPSTADECEYSPPSAKLFGMTSAPSFSTDEKTPPSARVSFLDLNKVTLGFFENVGAETAPTTWILESKQGLQAEMVQIKRHVDGLITETDKHPLAAGDHDIAKHLKDKLFNCRFEPGGVCLGMQAYEELMNIARPDPRTVSTGSERVRVRATFRDISNNIYYLPLHLLRIDDNHRLGDVVRIEQPLPIPFNALTVKGCTNEFAIGLVVQDDESLDEKQWRTNWLARMQGKACTDHFYSDISKLKNNFFRKYDPKINPMGLVLLSHHGGGEIADTDKQTDPDRLINSSDLIRDFGAGSFAILASCSVGAMDEKHQDNSLFLHSLNEKHINAAIVSLFNVPPEVAKSFLDALQNTLLTLKEDTTLFDVFEKSKKQYGESLKNTPLNYLIPKIDLFMLVGDGDVKICKYAQ